MRADRRPAATSCSLGPAALPAPRLVPEHDTLLCAALAACAALSGAAAAGLLACWPRPALVAAWGAAGLVGVSLGGVVARARRPRP